MNNKSLSTDSFFTPGKERIPLFFGQLFPQVVISLLFSGLWGPMAKWEGGPVGPPEASYEVSSPKDPIAFNYVSLSKRTTARK